MDMSLPGEEISDRTVLAASVLCPLVCRGAGPLWRLGERGELLTAQQLVLPVHLWLRSVGPIAAGTVHPASPHPAKYD